MNFDLSNNGLRNWALLAVTIFFLFIAYEMFTKPRTYEDCILKNIKGGSRGHAQLIALACSDKFKDK